MVMRIVHPHIHAAVITLQRNQQWFNQQTAHSLHVTGINFKTEVLKTSHLSYQVWD